MLFHQSGGCCDGSSPMCYPRGDLILGDLVIDAVSGLGGMFSLDNGRGKRFLTRSTLCELPRPR